MKPTTDLCLKLRLRYSGATSPLPNTFIVWTCKTTPYPLGRPKSFPNFVFGQQDETIQRVRKQSNCSEPAYVTISFEAIYNQSSMLLLYTAKLSVLTPLTFYRPPATLRTIRFNIQKFYMVITSRLCVLRTNNDFCLMQHNSPVFITEAESVYWAVRSESLYNGRYGPSLKG